jgi:hypothetical protein
VDHWRRRPSSGAPVVFGLGAFEQAAEDLAVFYPDLFILSAAQFFEIRSVAW